MKIGNRVDDLAGMPAIEVMVHDETFYLMPFRGYCMQVCGDVYGGCDCGSSRVIGFGNVTTAKFPKKRPDSKTIYSTNCSREIGPDSIVTELFLGQAAIALLETAKQYHDDMVSWDYNTQKKLREFCNAAIAYVMEPY